MSLSYLLHFSIFLSRFSLSSSSLRSSRTATTEAALDAKFSGWFKLATASGDMPRRCAVAGETARTHPLTAYLPLPAPLSFSEILCFQDHFALFSWNSHSITSQRNILLLRCCSLTSQKLMEFSVMFYSRISCDSDVSDTNGK